MNGARRGRRAQLVLVAAAVIAIALVPVVAAYLQLGYHDDVRAASGFTAPAENAERVLGRAVHRAGANATGEFDWSERDAAVAAVRDDLAGDLETLRAARVAEGTVYGVAYNESAAGRWAADHCPGGPNRQFGDCEAIRGVVVQERVGETHVLGVAFDVTVTTRRGETALTVVVPVVD